MALGWVRGVVEAFGVDFYTEILQPQFFFPTAVVGRVHGFNFEKSSALFPL